MRDLVALETYNAQVANLLNLLDRAVDIIVCGDGPVGMAAALAAAKAGRSVTLIGARTSAAVGRTDDFDARVYAISPSSMGLLDRLGVSRLLDGLRLAPVYNMRLFTLGQSAELDLNAYESCVERLATITEHCNLVTALRSGLDAAAQFTRLTVSDAQIIGLDVKSDHALVELNDGQTLRCKLLIGADGANSIVRGLAQLTAAEKSYDQSALVVNVTCEQSHLDAAYQWFGPSGVLALLPLPSLPESRFNVSIVWSVATVEAERLQGLSNEELAGALERACERKLGAMTVLNQAQLIALRQVKVDRTVGARVLLVGDAAHVVHPLAGQGMNLGFGDVAALAECLGQAVAAVDCGDQSVLRRYGRSRKEAVALMQTTIDRLQGAFEQSGSSPVVSRMRELAWQAVANSSWLRRRIVQHAVAN
jgi:2-polyprenylphenol 6-hydroxylase